MSDHIVSYWTQFRRDKNYKNIVTWYIFIRTDFFFFLFSLKIALQVKKTRDRWLSTDMYTFVP